MFLDACPPSSSPLLSLQFSPAPSGPMYPSFQSIWHRPQSRACWICQPHLYSILFFFKIWLSVYPYPPSPFFATHATHMPARFIQLLHQTDSAERAGKDWEGCLYQEMEAAHGIRCRQPSAPVHWKGRASTMTPSASGGSLTAVAVNCNFCREEGFQMKCPRSHWFFFAAFWAHYS